MPPFPAVSDCRDELVRRRGVSGHGLVGVLALDEHEVVKFTATTTKALFGVSDNPELVRGVYTVIHDYHANLSIVHVSYIRYSRACRFIVYLKTH